MQAPPVEVAPAPPAEIAQAPAVEAVPLPPPEEPVTSTWEAPTPVRESSPLESVSRSLTGEFEQDDLDVPAFLRKRGENR